MTTVTDRDLANLLLAAAMLCETNPVFLPIFMRLQSEFDARSAKSDALSKARELAATHKSRNSLITQRKPAGEPNA